MVEDNGQGFNSFNAAKGQGLLSMEDYVMAQGGTIEVMSAPGFGTRVVASFPSSSV